MIKPLVQDQRITHAVFTVPNCNPPELHDTCRRLVAAFRRLRGDSGGKSKPLPPFGAIEGYIWTLEVTYNPRSKTFHPHIHALFDAPFMDQKLANRSWKTACESLGFHSRSWKVWLARVKAEDGDISGAAAEVAKYATKPPPLSQHTTAPWLYLIAGLRYVRTADSGGSLSLPRLKRPSSGRYTFHGGLKAWLRKHDGTPQAKEIKSLILQDKTLGRIAAQHYSPLDLIPWTEEPEQAARRRRGKTR